MEINDADSNVTDSDTGITNVTSLNEIRIECSNTAESKPSNEGLSPEPTLANPQSIKKKPSSKCNIFNNRKFMLTLFIVSVTVAVAVFVLLGVLIYFLVNNQPSSGTKTTKPHSNSTVQHSCFGDKQCSSGFFSILSDSTKECTCHKHPACFADISDTEIECDGLVCALDRETLACKCDIGYIWSNENELCHDVNECTEFSCNNVTTNTSCINTDGGFECSCRDGFVWSVMFTDCIDVNECDSKPCSGVDNSVCINTFGSYYCVCENGYKNTSSESTSLECADINECEKANLDPAYTKKCDNSTRCSNLPGSYECCNSSFCYKCGYQYFKPNLMFKSNAKIIGGQIARNYSWPWMVSIGINYKYRLFIANTNQIVTLWYNNSHLCGGTLISNRYILSAAHCFHNLVVNIPQYDQDLLIKPNRFHTTLASIFTVYVGVQDQANDKLSDSNIFKLSSIKMHEKFDPRSFLNDIALLELEKPIRKTIYVDWICLGGYLGFSFPEIGAMTYAIGFGSTIESSASSSNFLRQVDLKLLKFNFCDLVTNYMLTNTESQFCAGYLDGSKDTCVGDSGSPIMYKWNGHFYVIGIVSYGQGCGRPFKPGINTNVSYYLDWIGKNMAN